MFTGKSNPKFLLRLIEALENFKRISVANSNAGLYLIKCKIITWIQRNNLMVHCQVLIFFPEWKKKRNQEISNGENTHIKWYFSTRTEKTNQNQNIHPI